MSHKFEPWTASETTLEIDGETIKTTKLSYNACLDEAIYQFRSKGNKGLAEFIRSHSGQIDAITLEYIACVLDGTIKRPKGRTPDKTRDLEIAWTVYSRLSQGHPLRGNATKKGAACLTVEALAKAGIYGLSEDAVIKIYQRMKRIIDDITEDETDT